MLDENTIGAIHLQFPIPDDTLFIPTGLSLNRAEAHMKEIQEAMAVAAHPNMASSSD